MKAVEFLGKKFGMLTVMSELPRHIHKSGKPSRRFLCLCDCGKELSVVGQHLRSGHTESCGCTRAQSVREKITTHGMSNSPERIIHKHMIRRCKNPEAREYKNYGGRGITVCREWTGKNGLRNFIGHVGLRPGSEYTIDRIDNNKGYEPGNVRWATREDQIRNRRNSIYVEYNGETKFLYDICIETGVNYYTARNRLRRGVKSEDLFSQAKTARM